MSLELDALVEAFESEDALDDSGYVMTFGSAAGKVKKAGASDVILGFAFASTKNPITGTAEANKMVGIVKPRRGIVMRLKVTPAANRATAIAIGDEVVVDDVAAGTICQVTDSAGPRVGYAREALAADADPADGKIEVEINAE